MSKVYVFVVIGTYFNGENDQTYASRVFTTQEGAKTFCDKKNAERESCYATEFDYVEVELHDSAE